MRHARRRFRMSGTSAKRQAALAELTRNLLRHGRIRTTVAKAKAAKRTTERLITLGKDGSIHARRRAYAVLRDRQLVKQVFADIAPRFLDCPGGYTRLLKLSSQRRGDGASLALLELTRLPVEAPKAAPKAKTRPQPTPPPSTPAAKPTEAETKPKSKRFFEGLRDLFHPKKGGASS